MLAVVWMRVAAQETEVPEQSVMCGSWMWGDGEEPRTAPGFSPFSFFGLSSWVPFTQTDRLDEEQVGCGKYIARLMLEALNSRC